MQTSHADSTDKTDPRQDLARNWLLQLGLAPQTGFQAVAGDASFRRYFRLRIDGTSRILMDAPPPGEDVGPFIDIARRLRAAGLHAPEVIHADPHNGFLLLEDLGDEMYRSLLDKNTQQQNADSHFPGLLDLLAQMALTVDCEGLPTYDTGLLRTEMDLFPDWYLGHHRTGMRRGQFDACWDEFCGHIINAALEQPQSFVHRDFHSCNLLRTTAGDIGIIDFQDAVKGPVSYDFISLIWDRYINWPRTQLEQWMEDMRLRLKLDINPQQWQRYCDLMGLQRNIKIVGIFARLNYRDGKNGYIEMIPRFYQYITGTLRRYPEFNHMLTILEHPECAP